MHIYTKKGDNLHVLYILKSIFSHDYQFSGKIIFFYVDYKYSLSIQYKPHHSFINFNVFWFH